MSGETPSHDKESFVAPQTEEELEKVVSENMNFEQNRASHVREKTYKVFGQETPTIEWTPTRDGMNNGILRGAVKGVELELQRRHSGYKGKSNFGSPTDPTYEYSGTMNGLPLQPKDAERLFEHLSSSSTKEHLEQVTREAAESIQPKEVPEDAYQQSLDMLLGSTPDQEKS